MRDRGDTQLITRPGIKQQRLLHLQRWQQKQQRRRLTHRWCCYPANETAVDAAAAAAEAARTSSSTAAMAPAAAGAAAAAAVAAVTAIDAEA